MTWRAALTGAALFGAALVGGASIQAQEGLVVDLSDDVIAITAGFSGSEVLAFGATDGDGDVIVVVRGPPNDLVVRRKERILGIWANRAQAHFIGVPSYYQLAASAPVAELLAPEVLRDKEIGLDHLNLPIVGEGDDGAGFRAGLVRQQTGRGLYSDGGQVSFVDNRLFRTRVAFPASVQPGAYLAQVFLVRDKQIVGTTTTRLHVSRFGFEARMFDFAHEQSALYGLVAIAIALVAGWFAGFVFRRA